MGRSTRKQVEAAQAEISAQLTHLPDNFLDCRDPGLRHQWVKTKDFYVVPVKQLGRKVANLEREETCARCETVKTEHFIVNKNDLLEKVGQVYSYPEGYLMSNAGVPRGVKRSSAVWGENYNRAMAAAASGTRKSSKVTPIRKTG